MCNDTDFNELFKTLCNRKNEKIEKYIRDEIYKSLKPYNFTFKETMDGFNSISLSKDRINFAVIVNALQEARQLLRQQESLSKQQAESFFNPEIHSKQIAKDCITLIRKKLNQEITIEDYTQEMYKLHDKYPDVLERKNFKENAQLLENRFRIKVSKDSVSVSDWDSNFHD